MKSKWNNELRKIIYTALTVKFGSFDVDNNLVWPPKGKTAEWKQALDDISKTLTMLTGETFTPGAVECQVVQVGAFIKDKSPYNAGIDCMMNISTAYECGWLEKKSSIPKFQKVI